MWRLTGNRLLLDRLKVSVGCSHSDASPYVQPWNAKTTTASARGQEQHLGGKTVGGAQGCMLSCRLGFTRDLITVGKHERTAGSPSASHSTLDWCTARRTFFDLRAGAVGPARPGYPHRIGPGRSVALRIGHCSADNLAFSIVTIVPSTRAVSVRVAYILRRRMSSFGVSICGRASPKSSAFRVPMTSVPVLRPPSPLDRCNANTDRSPEYDGGTHSPISTHSMLYKMCEPLRGLRASQTTHAAGCRRTAGMT